MKYLLFLSAVCALAACNKGEVNVNTDQARRSAETAAHTVGDAATRASTTARVKTALTTASDVQASRIDVDTMDDGTIYLQGYARTEAEKEKAGRIAADTAGSQYKIINNLVIRPN